MKMLPLFLAAAVLAMPAQQARAQTILGEATACAQGSGGPAVLAYFEGLKDRTGKLRLELFPDTDADFLADDFVLLNAGKTFRRIELPTPASGLVAVCMRLPRAGRYTMAMIHDRDGLRKFSFTVDGIGFPGNPKMGWGKPKAERAMISVGASVTVLHVEMNYLRGFGFSPLRHGG